MKWLACFTVRAVTLQQFSSSNVCEDKSWQDLTDFFLLCDKDLDM